ncbi:aminotransferase class V-fold PLP-dependent enzyme [Chitinophaga sp. MM2321]|uniref:aminotransferase class V-fold PLP-dependent enzyme n=1 Tax=Chitinophaga sp. MM2321 TaxID=3137178 RepID=UPI0032D56D53
MDKWRKIRADYPACKNYVYLATNGGGPVSTPYVQKAQQLLTALSEKGKLVMPEWGRQVTQTRTLLADMIQAKATEIAFITNTSQAMGLLVGMFPKHYDVLTMRDEFPTGFVPWMHHGHHIQFVDSNAAGEISITAIENQITPATRLLITSHVLFRTGFRQDLKAIGALCRKHGLVHIVDATQSFGVYPIDVQEYNIDILIFHAYKWVTAGYGSGGMYVSKKILDKYPPQVMGWYNVNYPLPDFDTAQDYTQFTPKEDATVFETGTPPFLNILLLGEALQYLNGIGIPEINAYVQTLINYLHKRAKENNIRVLSDYAAGHLSTIQRLAVTPEQYTAIEQHHIAARYKNNMLTIALNFYNNEEDIDTLLAVIKKSAPGISYP